MKYIKFTYVDSTTGVSVDKAPAKNGPVFPDITGLQFIRARESQYPTAVPQFYGTCDDADDTSIGGVLAVMTEQAWTAELLEELKAQTTALRWRVMTGGIDIGGVSVGTTIDDQNRITSVVANAALTGLTDADEVNFKASSGWVRVTIGQIKAMAGAIGQHVQACYTAERTHHESIDILATPEQMNTYDVNSGWPS